MKSRVHERDQRAAVGRRERALAEAGAGEAAVRDRVERAHELVALAVLAQREPAGRRAEHLGRRPRVQPDHDALVDVADLLVGEEAAGEEEARARRARTTCAPSRCRASRGRSRSREGPSRGRSTRRARACTRPRSRAAGRRPSAAPARAPRASRAGTPRGRRSGRSSRARPAGTRAGRCAPRGARR